MTTLSNSRPAVRPLRPPDRSPAGRWWLLAVVGLAQFMLILDVTVVNVALPRIGTDLHLHPALLPWVLTGYTVAFGGLMLVGGRVADTFGARRTVLAGLAVFVAGSLASGLAPVATVLLAGRIAQGVGAAVLSPSALALVTTAFQGRDRARALGVWAVLGGAGSVLGVVAGGLLTSGPGWRWIFFINVPAGVLVAALVPLLAPRVRAGTGGRPLDLPGGLLVTAATGALLYGLIHAGTHGWRAAGTLTPLAASVVLYLAFGLLERAVPAPLMPPRVLRQRGVLAGALLMLAATGLLIGGLFLASFDLQRLRGYTALGTGLALLPVAVGTVLGAHTAGRLATRTDRRVLAGAGMALTGIGFAVAAAWHAPAGLISGLAVAAAGAGTALVTATVTALSGLEQHEAGVRSGIVNTFHELGGALGVAALSAAATGLATAAPASGGFTHGLAIAAVTGLASAALAPLVVPPGIADSVPRGH